MAKRYYVDTSIWVDIYEDRKGHNQEPLGDFALRLFGFIRANKYKLIITDLLIRELEMNYSMPEINGMMKPFEKIIEKIIATKKQRDEAKKIGEEKDVPSGDVLHAIIARDHNLTLITRDNHFRKLRDIAEYHKPEDII